MRIYTRDYKEVKGEIQEPKEKINRRLTKPDIQGREIDGIIKREKATTMIHQSDNGMM